jgi:purine-nucleoside phosphorylase
VAFLSAAGWLRCLRLSADEVPQLVVLEGTWWANDKAAERLGRLEGARELALPGLYHGWYAGVPVAFGFVYGAARAVEPVHIFGEIGSTPTVVLIGSCGGIAPLVSTGDVVLPEQAVIEESTSQHYRAPAAAGLQATGETEPAGQATGDAGLLDRAGAVLDRQGITVHRGITVTTSALLTQHQAQVSAWASAGCLAVDLETSAVYSAAAQFGMTAAALLYCWDELSRGRSWLDTFTPAEAAAQRAADRATYTTALEIGCGIDHKETKAWN